MENYLTLSMAARDLEQKHVEGALQDCQALNLELNLSRGNPPTSQLDQVSALFREAATDHYLSEEGLDCRNYGGLLGLWEMRVFFADLINSSPERVWVLGSSSLNIEYDLLTRCLLFPLPGMTKPWGEKRKFLCPVPGYDRHFAISELLGFESIPVPLLEDGPDMDLIEELCANDPTIKGMWAVPVYSNPDGTCYSKTCLERLLSMKAAPDFRIFADLAYCAHHFDEANPPEVPDLLTMATEAGHPDRVFVFASTSKITYAGSGEACVALSDANQDWLIPSLTTQMIGADKMNQLRHAEVFRQVGGMRQVLDLHRPALREKFHLTFRMLAKHLAPAGIAKWREPEGGYFVSVELLPGTARATVKRCRELGLILTPAGSMFPGGLDPNDSFIRLAPTFPDMADLEKALLVFCLSARAEALRKLSQTEENT